MNTRMDKKQSILFIIFLHKDLNAESLYLTKYIERMGTGVGDMIERCRNAGLLEPEFYLTDGFVTIIRRRPEQALKAVTPQVTPVPLKSLHQWRCSCAYWIRAVL